MKPQGNQNDITMTSKNNTHCTDVEVAHEDMNMPVLPENIKNIEVAHEDFKIMPLCCLKYNQNEMTQKRETIQRG